MVGIPGKSKGCNTCRRRRVKCDEAKPECQRCIKAGRMCEGYVRGPVFLNRTQEGLLPRRHLEELETIQQSAQPAAVLNIVQRTASRLPQQIDIGPALRKGLEGYFVQRYIPSSSRSGDDPGSVGQWPSLALNLQDKGEALEYALTAMITAQAGWDQKDARLMMHAQDAYSRALKAAQKVINDPAQSMRDQTITCVNIFKVYEVLILTSGTKVAYDAHIHGLVALVQHRKERNWATDLGKHLYNETRWSAMVLSLQHRKRSPLGEETWSPKVWNTGLDVHQSLCSLGLALASAAEDLDGLSWSSGLDDPLQAANEIMSQLVSISAGLIEWHTALSQGAHLSLEWTDPDGLLGEARTLEKVSADPRPVISPIAQQLLSMDFWALQIDLNYLVYEVKAYLDSHQIITAMPQLGSSLQYAQNIALTVSEAMSGDAGAYVCRRCVFPLRTAMIPLRDTHGEEEVACREQLEQLVARAGHTNGLKEVFDLLSNADTWRSSSPDR